MDWIQDIRNVIDYMETHLLEENVVEKALKEVAISQFYLQKGFKIMTGYSMTEYTRNRRLYLASLDVIAEKEKVIDIAFKYGYDTPESFTKAFSRFHGLSPIQLKKDRFKLKVFLPLKINVIMQGGYDMNYVVEKMDGFKVIGFDREFTFEEGFMGVPKFWDDFCKKYCQPLTNKAKSATEIEETICRCNVGEYGVCIDDSEENGYFHYLIAGGYQSGEIPKGMRVYEIPELEWAKFACTGPLPESLKTINTRIFNEWLPGNPDYETAMGINIEWYSEGDSQSTEYESEIWIPVKRK